MTRVIFHASTKIESFQGADGQTCPSLISGDNFEMDERDARSLELQGAGHVRHEEIKEYVPGFQRASDLSVITDGMERETDAINKLDRDVKQP